MSATLLAPTGAPVKSVRVKILADTVVNQSGRGIPVWKGSVIDVAEFDAAMLFAGNKAEKSTDGVKIVENPNTPKKVS